MVSDGELSAQRPVQVTVREVNQAPLLTAIGDKVVNEGEALSFQVQASDPDLPANTLTYALTGTVPPGALLNSATGAFTWTPTAAQGPARLPVPDSISCSSSLHPHLKAPPGLFTTQVKTL